MRGVARWLGRDEAAPVVNCMADRPLDHFWPFSLCSLLCGLWPLCLCLSNPEYELDLETQSRRPFLMHALLSLGIRSSYLITLPVLELPPALPPAFVCLRQR